MNRAARTVLLLCCTAVLTVAQNSKCWQCASPQLENNWEITSFPTRPDNLVFTSECNYGYQETDTFQVDCPASPCLELIIPFEKKALFLRGCYNSFINFASNVTRQSELCEYGSAYGGNNTITNDKNGESGVGQNLLHLCSTDECNKAYEDVSSLYKDPSTYFKNCTSNSKKTCVFCSHYDGNGKCKHDTETTCQGEYCSKYSGHLADEWFEIRGCAPVSPFVGDQCSWIEKDAGVFLDQGSLSVPYRGTHCFCKGDRCNPSNPLFSSLLPLLLCCLLPFLSLSLFSYSLSM